MKTEVFFAIILFCLSIATRVNAQINGPVEDYSDSPLQIPSIQLKYTSAKILLDGNLDEPVWQNASPSGGFWQYFPADTSLANGRTELRMIYDDNFLYVGVKCHTSGDEFIVPSLRRDYSFRNSDNITLLFDTYNDQTNAFVFGMNAYGVRREALVSEGGRQNGAFNSSWDNKWYGDAETHDNYWTAEFAIPFSTLRFKKGGTQWRFNCYRSDTQLNELSSWIRIPRNYIIMDLSYMGNLVWDKPLEEEKTNISVIPYASGGAARDFDDETQTKTDVTSNIGVDFKVGVTPSLNLDLTFNPDFSQVEVDQQVTNLNRFEIFFPERRQFFLENADLFGSFGLSRANPFFSRRIGVSRDTATGQNIQNPILYGARLSGKLNNKLRVGLLNMQTVKQDETGLPGFNYTVAALQHQVYDKSNISFIMVNKEAINAPVDTSGLFNKYNRVMGLEYRLASQDNRWTGKIYHHQVFSPVDKKNKFSNGVQLEYLLRNYRFEWASSFVGYGYDVETGFAPRRDYLLMSPEMEFLIFPKKGNINEHSINIDTRFFLEAGNDPENLVVNNFNLSERQTEVQWSLEFKNTARAAIGLVETDLTLLKPFEPTGLQADSVFLAAGTDYHYLSFEGSYRSDQRQRFSFELEPTIGQFFNGLRAGLSGSLEYRFQPYGSIGLNMDYNYVELAKPFKPVNIWLVGPRFDLTFTKNIFFTTFIQYNNQLENVNINTRFQWRFQPVSDFFLVYTDNYFVDPFSQFSKRNRSLVAKVTYWLNI